MNPPNSPKCEHDWHEHCHTDINAAGVHREYWRECVKCGEAQGNEGEPIEHPRADCEGCKRPDCPCNAVGYEGEAVRTPARKGMAAPLGDKRLKELTTADWAEIEELNQIASELLWFLKNRGV